MREICRAVGLTVDEFMELLRVQDPRQYAQEMPIIREVRRQKKEGLRNNKPSKTLIDESVTLSAQARHLLLDKTAEFVDENATGRSDMCREFAALLSKALNYLRCESRLAVGTVSYYDSKGALLFSWPKDGHTWIVVAGDELIDGNCDSLAENHITLSKGVSAAPYWGPRLKAPRDRKYNENKGARSVQRLSDVEDIWWPDFEKWIAANLSVLDGNKT